MATDPSSYLSAAIIIGVFSLVALFGGIAIPLIERGKLKDQITSDQMLTREDSLAWGTVPGSRNISYVKEFQLFSFDNVTADQVLQGNFDVKLSTSATYSYTYQYSDLQFSPSANGSVQYFNSYNHTYMGTTEDTLKTLTVDTVNIGAFRGITQQANMSQAQIFIQSLYRIYESFQQDIVTLLISDYAFEFYIKNQTLTNSTIFMYDQTVTGPVSDQLWNDPEYGWSQSSTLLHWVTIAIGYVGNFNYNPQSVPEYALLKSHFGLTDDQMIALVGAKNPGQTGVTSMLYLIITAVQSAISGQNGCSMPNACNPQELFALQFFQANITKNPVFQGIEPKNSIAELNKTYPVAPEIASVNTQNTYFDQNLANSLFGFNGNLPATGTTTLFGLQNVEMLIENQDNPSLIQTYFGLSGTDQAQVLINYVNYIINQFAYQNQTNLTLTKYIADAAVNNMNNLAIDIANLINNNITAMGVYSLLQSQDKTCEELLQDISPLPALVGSICNNPAFTLDTAEGLAPWVTAFYAGSGSGIYTIIESATGIADSDLQNLMQPLTQLGGSISTVVTAIGNALNCGGPCAASFLSSLQWATSGATKALPAQYFDKTYESLADVFPNYFNGFVPEFPVYAKRELGVDLTITMDQAATLLGYDVGSINNNYEMLKLISMSQTGNYAGIQERFAFSQDQVNAFFAYFDSAFINYFMGGLTKTISVYDLLWGYNDTFLTSLSNANFFNNIQMFNPEVSLLGNKDSSDDSSDVTSNMIDSGADNSSNVRHITSYNGNNTLSINQTSFDGNVYYSAFSPAWGGNLQSIAGSDGSGFSPLLAENTPITIFEGPFMRNLNYNYQDTISLDFGSTYNFYQYQFDQSQLKASNIYYNTIDGYMNLTGFDSTPLLISLPYYQGCDASSFSSVTFGGAQASALQETVPKGGFTVEALSGITANFTKGYQYNIYNYMPYTLLKQNTPTALPLFVVSETYTTPPTNYDNDVQSYYLRSRSITTAMIVVLAVALAMMVTSIILFIMYRISSKRLAASRLNANPGDFASLGVDSDGARSSLHPLTQTLTQG